MATNPKIFTYLRRWLTGEGYGPSFEPEWWSLSASSPRSGHEHVGL